MFQTPFDHRLSVVAKHQYHDFSHRCHHLPFLGLAFSDNVIMSLRRFMFIAATKSSANLFAFPSQLKSVSISLFALSPISVATFVLRASSRILAANSDGLLANTKFFPSVANSVYGGTRLVTNGTP